MSKIRSESKFFISAPDITMAESCQIVERTAVLSCACVVQTCHAKVRSKSGVSLSCVCRRVAQVDFGASVRAAILGICFPAPKSHPIHPLGALSKQKVSKQKPWRLSTPDTLRCTTLRFQEFELASKATSLGLLANRLAKPDFRLRSWLGMLPGKLVRAGRHMAVCMRFVLAMFWLPENVLAVCSGYFWLIWLRDSGHALAIIWRCAGYHLALLWPCSG